MRSGVPTSCGDGSLRARVEVVDLVVALVPDARRVHPPEHVAAAIRARQPHVLADRERHRPAGAVDLVGELHAGGRRADDQHAAFGQLSRIAVVERRELLDRRRHAPRAAAGTLGDVAGAAREHDAAAAKLAVARRDVIAVVRAASTDVTVGVRAHRRARTRRRSAR